MATRRFTAAEIELHIPALEQIFAQLTLAVSALAHPPAAQPREELEEQVARVRGLMARVDALGGVIRDLGSGLVDFPTTRRGRKAWLCWQFGEKRIAFWHGEGEGFAGRKPLKRASARLHAELLN